MKQTLFILFSLIASLVQAVAVKEATNVNNSIVEGGIFPASAVAVYAHVNASPTVMSSVIDLGSVPGFYVTITGTANQIDVWWSVTPTAATFRREYSLNSSGSKFLSKQGRYAKFAVSPSNLTYTTATVFYVLADTLPVNATIASGGAAQAVTTIAIAGTAATSYYDKLTTGVKVVGWVPLTQTAYTGLTTNANATFGITATAGSSAYTAYRIRVSAETGVVSLRFTQHNGATVSTGFGASNGHQLLPNDRPQWLGPYTIVGSVPYFTLRASALSGATSGTAWIEIEGQP